jgi:hypothetical protein
MNEKVFEANKAVKHEAQSILRHAGQLLSVADGAFLAPSAALAVNGKRPRDIGSRRGEVDRWGLRSQLQSRSGVEEVVI